MDGENGNYHGAIRGQMSSLNIEIEEYANDFASMDYHQLAKIKQSIEKSLEHLFDLLHNTYKFDMHQPLVIDGYPRSDIDVMTVRLLRSKIIHLRNDHASLMNILQSHLSDRLSQNNASLADQPASGSVPSATVPERPAFALVRDVAKNSPAERAGLRVGDMITLFDSNIHADNHKKLAAIASRVSTKKNIQVPIVVKRENNLVDLQLIPTDNWEGRGLLGCFIVPI